MSLEEIMVRLKAGLSLESPGKESDDLVCIRFLFESSRPLAKDFVKLEEKKTSIVKERLDLQETHIVNRLGYEIFIAKPNQDLAAPFNK